MAKKFRFRLDVVERIRRQARDAQQRKVARAVRAVQRVEDHMTALSEQLRQNVDAAATTMTAAGLDVALVRSQEFHRGWLQRQMMLTQDMLSERQRELSAERGRLAEATKQLRVIEKLRDKQWQRHTLETTREEQAMSDEMSLARFLRTARTHAAGRVE